MKKRVLALLLALVMTLGLAPVGALAAGETEPIGKVTFSVETKTIDGEYIVEPMPEELYADDTVYTLLSRVAEEQNFAVSGAENGYVTQIGDFSTYGYGSESGWMVAINNDHTTWPQPQLKDGDTVRFCYTYKTYGYDIDLLDLVDELEKKVEEATCYEGNNETAVYEALEEGTEKLSEIQEYGSNQSYLDHYDVGIYGPNSEISRIEALILKLETVLAGDIYVPIEGATITLKNSDGLAATEVVAGRTYQAEIAFEPENATNQKGSGWKVETGMGADAVISSNGMIEITGINNDLYGLHMLTVQYWHLDAPYGCFSQVVNGIKGPQTDLDYLNVAKHQLTWDSIKGENTSSYAVTKDLVLPQTITPVDDQDPVTVSWTSSNPVVTVQDGKAVVDSSGKENQYVTLTAVLSRGTESITKTFDITVKSTYEEEQAQKAEQVNALLDTIAGTYKENSNEWVVMDMAAYEDLKADVSAKTTAKAKQEYINAAIKAVKAGTSPAARTYSKADIILRSVGADATKLYGVNDNTVIDTASLLRSLEITDLYDAPWVLLANMQGDLQLTEDQISAIVTMLERQQQENGLYGDTWEGQAYNDIDTTGTVIAALSSLYGSNTTAKNIVDQAITGLSLAQGNNGSFGSSNSDAMVIIGLAAMGINSDTDTRFVKSGNSLLDGLLSYAFSDNSGFGCTDNTTHDNMTAMATEQGFRALIAASQVMSAGTAYNVYDFSKNEVKPARATNDEAAPPVTPPEEGGDSITATVTIKADTGYWLNSKSVTVSEGSAVYHAFVKALNGTGITQEGAETGYVTSMTKNGKTLAEFSNGPDSGWLYKVNGKLPTVGLTSCKIKDGDLIVFYYTNDWTTDPDAGGIVTPPAQNGSALTPSAPVNAKGEATAKIPDKDLTAAIDAAKKNNEDIVIEPVVKGEADTVSVQLPKTGVASAAKSTDADLVVKTDLGSVTVPNEALASIAEQAAGSTVTIAVAEKTAADVADKTIDTTGAVIAEVTVTSDDKEITTFDGQSLTVSIPVSGKSWTAGETYDVIVLSGSGAKETLAGRCVKADGGLAVQVEVSHLSTFIVTPNRAENIPFTDLTGHWAMDEVTTAWKLGLMNGVSGTRFAPDKTLSRAMAATILYRLAGSPASDGALTFTDVEPGQWYSDAIAWAAGEGIVDGVKPDQFAPKNNVTRQQLAVMLYRYVQTKDLGFTGDWTYDLDVTDRADVADWAYEAVCWMHQNGILKGRANGAIDPKGTATRAEAAALYVRLADILDP